MKIIPKKSKRNFIPTSISESLKTINRKFLYKFGKIDYIIHSKWSDIVGDFFVSHSEPLKITSVHIGVNEDGSNLYNKYLHVNVSPAAAIEFQHFQNKIIEKINSYFGYKAIVGIKIHQNQRLGPVNKKRNKRVNLIDEEKNKLEIIKNTPKLSNKDLEESIVKLGLSITNEK